VEEQWSGYFDHCDSNHWLHFQQLDWERNCSYSGTNSSASVTMNGPITEMPLSLTIPAYSNADGNPYSYSNTDGYAHPLNPTPRSTATPKPNPNSSTATYGDDDGFSGEARR